MSKKDFFPKRPEAKPTIYAYKLPNDISRNGQLKIGYTTRYAHERIEEQVGATRAKYEIVLIETAIRNDGSSFTDHDIHKYLRKKGFINTDGEWFKCKVSDVKVAIIAVQNNELNEEKEYKSLRKKIQDKLIKFATRIPVFMYLTDYRERSLKDVITQLEPGLFKKVTALDVKDFELIVSLGVFNSTLMNDAVYKFKRYEDASLEYIGINKHEGEDVGLWETTISSDDYIELIENE